MTWGMILNLYAGKEEKSIEITKYRVINSDKLEKILAKFLENRRNNWKKEQGKEDDRG